MGAIVIRTRFDEGTESAKVALSVSSFVHYSYELMYTDTAFVHDSYELMYTDTAFVHDSYELMYTNKAFVHNNLKKLSIFVHVDYESPKRHEIAGQAYIYPLQSANLG
jgi:hypothetical protein